MPMSVALPPFGSLFPGKRLHALGQTGGLAAFLDQLRSREDSSTLHGLFSPHPLPAEAVVVGIGSPNSPAMQHGSNCLIHRPSTRPSGW